MMYKPKISVILSTFNSALFLQDAIDSILNQTYKDIELLLIDDGSTDETPSLLKNYHDPRLIVISNRTNLGLITSLNKGLAMARGEYIARMDADDISLPDRFLIQNKFLDEYPKVGVVGTWMQVIDEWGKLGRAVSYPEEDAVIKWEMLINSSIAHATTMMKTHVIRQVGGYEDVSHTEDYDLWQRLKSITQFHNIPQILYLRREHSNRVSVTKHEIQLRNTILIRKKYLEHALQRSIPQDVVVKIANPTIYCKDSVIIAKFYNELFQVYLHDNNISKKALNQIKSNVAQILYVLSKDKPYKMTIFLLKAFYLNPKLLFLFFKSILGRFHKWVGSKPIMNFII